MTLQSIKDAAERSEDGDRSEVCKLVEEAAGSKHLPRERERMRTVMVASLGGLYAIFLTVLGIVFPLGYFLSHRTSAHNWYLSVFHIYLYTTSIAFLLYVHISMRWSHKHAGKQKDQSIPMNIQADASSMNDETERTNPEHESSSQEKNKTDNGDTNDIQTDTKVFSRQHLKLESKEEVLFAHASEGVNFYLRLGVIGFAMGAVLQDGFNVVQFIDGSEEPWNCYGIYFFIVLLLRVLFVLLQSFFIFKNHQLVLNYQHALMKFGLLHTMATNLCVWALCVVLEAAESFVHNQPDTRSNTTMSHAEKSQANGTVLTSVDCLTTKTLANKAAPYLFPFTIEFSLIAADIIYKIYSNVGALVQAEDMENRKLNRVDDLEHNECHKANTGLFAGLSVFVLTAVATCVLLVYNETSAHVSDAPETTTQIYAYTDISVNSLAFMATIVAFSRMRHLRYLDKVESIFDQNLVILALAGYYLIIGFGIVGCSGSIKISNFARLHIIAKLVNFIQATTQVVFIIDGLRRRALTSHQLTHKPARSLVTFLLICNLAMWLINSFLMKDLIHARVLRSFYGQLPWVIMVHMTLPLAIFFRFHSSICLSDIWSIAYRKDCHAFRHFVCKKQTENNLL